MSTKENHDINKKLETSIYNDPKYGLNFLGAKSAIDDLKNLPKYFKIGLIFGIFIILFFNFFSIEALNIKDYASYDQSLIDHVQKYDGTHFAPFIQYVQTYMDGSIIGNPGSNTIALVTSILYSINGLAAFTGLLSVSMIINNKKSQFLWGLINGFLYAIFAFIVGLTGDFLMNCFFVVFAPFGWWLFTYKHKKVNDLIGKKWWVKICWIVGTLIVIVGFIIAWYFLIPELYASISNKDYFVLNTRTMLWFDAVANGINTVGYIMQLYNIGEQFWLWEILNVIKIITFSPIVLGENYSITLMIQMIVWTSLGVIGLWDMQIKKIIIEYKTFKVKKFNKMEQNSY